jgi:hypothetical protein
MIEFEFHISPAPSSSRPPHRRGYLRNQLQYPPGEILVLGQSLGAVDSFVEVRDDSVKPTADLIAEEAEATHPAAPDWTSGDGPPSRRVAIRHGGTLDRVATFCHVNHKRRVIEVEGASAFEQRDRRLEDPAVESHRVASGAQGDQYRSTAARVDARQTVLLVG